MEPALVAGMGVAGLVAGVALDAVAARVPPAPTPADPEAPLAPVGSAPAEAVDPGLPETGPATTAGTASAAPGAPALPDWRTPGSGGTRPGPAERAAAGLVGGALLAGAAARFGPAPALAPYAVLFCGLLVLSLTDLRVGLVPRVFLYPTALLVAVGLVAASALASDWHSLWVAAASAACGFAVLFALWWFFPRGMGFGDVRLAGLVGGALGWIGPYEVYLGFAAAFVLGAVTGLALALRQGTGRKTRLPFGPALAAGCVVGVLWGVPLVNLWLGRS